MSRYVYGRKDGVDLRRRRRSSRIGRPRSRRRAVVAVQVAIALTVIVGFLAMAFDVGAMYNTRADLQKAVDSSALAAASMLADYSQGDPTIPAANIAAEYLDRNKVFGRTLEFGTGDLVFGRAVYDAVTETYNFTESSVFPNAVKVQLRLTADSPNQAMPLYFARVFGKNSVEVKAEAVAMMVPRDIAIVADLSGSHNDDSELRHYDETEINLYDVWTALPSDNNLDAQTDSLGFTSEVTVVDNGDGTSTVTVNLTSDDQSSTKALSHLTIGLPEAAWAQALASASSGGGYPVETGTDPTTGVSGLKFDETTLGDDAQIETEVFSFSMANQYLSDMVLATKAGPTYDDSVSYGLSPGPTWGTMNNWGTANINAAYNPTSDEGLQYLRYRSNWSDSELQAMYYAQGYISSEVNALMSSSYDRNGAYPGRVAVALGLARWRSGHDNGLWSLLGEDPGNGNNWVSVDYEMTWLVPFGDRTLSQSKAFWKGYANYMKGSSAMRNANYNFKSRFGLKTFVNYLMEKKPQNSQTPELAATPAQPMQAVKDSVTVMANLLVGLETNDQLSLEIYGETARHEIDLTDQYQDVSDRLNAMQAGHYDVWTNMGGGITRGIEELESTRARPIARKVMILLTDGRANVSASGNTNDYTNGPIYARDMAIDAASRGIMIFSVSVGSSSDQTLMDEIATIGGGSHFHAEGSIEQYSDQLELIFGQLGGTRPVELIK